MKKVGAIVVVNLLTTVRIIGVICLLPIYLRYGGVAAALLSIACYFTDFIDGLIARKCHASTFFGSTYDGVADKMFNRIQEIKDNGYRLPALTDNNAPHTSNKQKHNVIYFFE